MKTALVLGGGGSRGSYQVGVIKAIMEQKVKIDIITGTSIGALNGTVLAQHDEKKLYELWKVASINNILNGEYPKDFAMEKLLNDTKFIKQVLTQYQKYKVDTLPLQNLIKEYLNIEKLKKSKIDLGIVTVKLPTLTPYYVSKEEFYDNGLDYLMCTSACFPALPIYEFDKGSFIDGGYYDNLPFDLALNKGAENFILVDLEINFTHKHLLKYPAVKYIYPKENIGSILNFERSLLDRNMTLGYHDGLKAYGKLYGHKYTFKKDFKGTFKNFIYNTMLKCEANSILDTRLKNNNKIYLQLETYLNKSILTKDEITFAAIENILDILEIDTINIYEEKDIFGSIKAAFTKDVKIVQSEDNLEFFDAIVKNISGTSKVSLVKKAINIIKFPDNYMDIKVKYLDFDIFNTFLAYIIIEIVEKY